MELADETFTAARQIEISGGACPRLRNGGGSGRLAVRHTPMFVSGFYGGAVKDETQQHTRQQSDEKPGLSDKAGITISGHCFERCVRVRPVI